jgi:SAM-dependent methyltransferase
MSTRDNVTCDRPRYMARAQPRAFRALFSGSGVLDVENTRVRAYPGLGGPAPDTRALYRVALELVPEASRALDLGCGAGLGVLELLGGIPDVLGVDSDPDAVHFARHYLPQAKFELEQGGAAAAATAADLVCVVDVLGQVASPEQLLRKARRALGSGGRVFIAEPEAYPAQDLVPPVTRAFSRSFLSALLARSGLEPERWLDDVGQFVACLARPANDGGAWECLEAADLAYDRGDFAAALQQYSDVAQSASPSVALEARVGAARAGLALGRPDAAAAEFMAAARIAPESARPLAGLSLLSLQGDDRATALSLAVQALDCDPTEAFAAQALAESADSLQQEDALAAWRITSNLAPADLKAASELARHACARGDVAYAIGVLERLRQFRSDLGVDFHVTLAWLCLQAGRSGDARLEAEVARVMDPEAEAVLELWAELEAVPVRA